MQLQADSGVSSVLCYWLLSKRLMENVHAVYVFVDINSEL